MTIRIRHQNTLRTISAVKVRFGGILRTIRKISVRQGGALRVVFSTASPISASANGTFFGLASGPPFEPVLVTSNPVTVTPSGGTSPYSYSWADLSSWVVQFSNSTAATTTISDEFFPGSYIGTVRCTVADANSNTVSVDVPFELFVSNI